MELLREPAAGSAHAEARGLIDALADLDGDTYRHSLEVAATATAVGRRLGLSQVELVEVELGALLHDVGKLCLPTRLLTKPGRLTDAELRLVRRHPDWGADMVASVPGFEGVALIVRMHHERPDGLGYPDRLTHAQIPRAACIVSVCDAYGAMTKERPYRPPLTQQQALAELERHAGTQFDTDVVEALVGYVRLPEPIPA
jgi:two-component system cell cycle response regulator